MKRTVFVLLLGASGICRAEEPLLVGQWDCRLESVYLNANHKLTISGDGSYRTVARVLMNELVDLGTWKQEGDQLLFHRKVHISRDGREESPHKARHLITRLDDESLVFRYVTGATSRCTRSGQ